MLKVNIFYVDSSKTELTNMLYRSVCQYVLLLTAAFCNTATNLRSYFNVKFV